jgi:hypothetical protein
VRKVVVLFFVFLVASITTAVDKNVVFDEQAAWSYIRDMSTDDMLGRQSGHPGGVKGEEYIASRFEEWGIEPAGDDGTYFQTFTVPYWNVKQGTTLQIWAGGAHREFVYREDWRVQKFSGSGTFATEIVFAGYGIHAPDKDYDDYDGVDVKGKLVLVRTGAPKKLAKKLEEEAKIENRLKAAREHGARGVMVFRDPSAQSRFFRIRLEKEMYQPDFVILTAESRLTDFIFKEHENDLRFPFAEIDKTSKPMSFATGVKAYLSVNVEFDAERKTRNVLAKITGSDPQLKNEYVVIGGHMDHLGVSPSGEVYNGANDNASGTAVAMEIARVMKLGQANPKRTVIFGGWAAEEMGLLGSEHYCDHPTYPIEKTVTYINMDMVAHGEGKISYSGVYYGPQVWEVIKEKLPEEIQEYIEPGRGGPGGSDHTPFLAKGVPAFGTWSQGHHFKYHQVRDDIDLVKPEILKKVGDLVYASVMIMANEPGDFFEPRRQDTYHLKVQNLVNYEFSNLDMVLEHHGDEKDSHVDIQFAVVPEKEELSGNDLRVGMIEKLLSAQDKAKASEGLGWYISRAGVSANVRQGKTTLVTGLKGVRSFEDDPAWAKVLAKQVRASSTWKIPLFSLEVTP